MDIIQVLKALSDETRLRIINLLKHDILCVCEIEAVLENSQSNVSRHLAKLRAANLIYSEKKAQWVYYGLNNDTIQSYSFIKALLNEDLAKQPKYQEDLKKMRSVQEKSLCAPETKPVN